MNVKGTIVDVLAPQSGTGKNGAWIKKTYIVEVPGQYPKKVAVCVWGDKMPDFAAMQEVDFECDVESREFKDKWFTEVKAFKYELVSPSPNAPKSTKTESKKPHPAELSGDDGSDLPF